MSFILFFILAVFIFVLALILSLVRGISSLLFGRSSYSSKAKNTSDYKEYSNSSETTQKVFSKEEGEYVSYEEIKE